MTDHDAARAAFEKAWDEHCGSLVIRGAVESRPCTDEQYFLAGWRARGEADTKALVSECERPGNAGLYAYEIETCIRALDATVQKEERSGE